MIAKDEGDAIIIRVDIVQLLNAGVREESEELLGLLEEYWRLTDTEFGTKM